MKVKSNFLAKNILVIFLLCLVLAGVIYAMRYVRGDSFQSALALLFNAPAEKIWNWCPDGVEEVSFKKHIFTTFEDIRMICNIELEPATEIQEEAYEPVAKASSQNAFVILESNAQLEVFRVEGLPFRSQKLTDYLKAKVQAPN